MPTAVQSGPTAAEITAFRKRELEQMATGEKRYNIDRILRYPSVDPALVEKLVGEYVNHPASTEAHLRAGLKYSQVAPHAVTALLKSDDEGSIRAITNIVARYSELFPDITAKIEESSYGHKEFLLEHIGRSHLTDGVYPGSKMWVQAVVGSLSRLGTDAAEEVAEQLTQYRPKIYAAPVSAVFPKIKALLDSAAVVKNYNSYKELSLDNVIEQLRTINARDMVAQIGKLGRDSHCGSESDEKKVIAALKDIGTEDAQEWIGIIGRGSLSVRLDAIEAFEALRQNAEDICAPTAGLDASIKNLLDVTMNVSVLNNIPEANMPAFKAAFVRADERKLSGVAYVPVFERAVKGLEAFRAADLELAEIGTVMKASFEAPRPAAG